MGWRDIVTRWLSDKALNRDENVVLLDLLRHLVHANMVPLTLIDNSTLNSILLTQIMLESLAHLEVPAAPQGEHLYLPHERQGDDDVGSWCKKYKTDQNVGRTDWGEPLL